MKKHVIAIIVAFLVVVAGGAVAIHQNLTNAGLPIMAEEAKDDPVQGKGVNNSEPSAPQKENDPVVIAVPDDEEPAMTEEPIAVTDLKPVESSSIYNEPSGIQGGTETPEPSAEGFEPADDSTVIGPTETQIPEGGAEQHSTANTSNVWTAWDTFLALSPAAQDEYMKSFESIEAFTAWMVSAQAEWAAAHQPEEISPDGSITIGS